MKTNRFIRIIALCLASVIIFAACAKKPNQETPSTSPYYDDIKWTVSFNSRGGTSVDAFLADDGGLVAKPDNPNRDNYAFAGWYSDANYTNAWNFDEDKVERKLTLHAKWTNIWTVSFESNGGTDLSNVQVMDGNKLTEPQAPSQAGFSFVGWYTDAALKNQYNFDDAVTKNTTLHAKWDDKRIVITFYSHGGSSVPQKYLLEAGAIQEPEKPTKLGYDFVGWYEEAGLVNEWDFNNTISANKSLHAKWEESNEVFDSVELKISEATLLGGLSLGSRNGEPMVDWGQDLGGGKIKFTYEAEVAGTYSISMEYSRSMTFGNYVALGYLISVNGGAGELMSFFPNSPDWDTIKGYSAWCQITLSEGVNTIEITANEPASRDTFVCHFYGAQIVPLTPKYDLTTFIRNVTSTQSLSMSSDSTKAEVVFNAKTDGWYAVGVIANNNHATSKRQLELSINDVATGKSVTPMTGTSWQPADTLVTTNVRLEAGENKITFMRSTTGSNNIAVSQIYVKSIEAYTVEFDLDGGKISDNAIIESQEVLEGDKALYPGAPTKEDKVFVGWYVDAEELVQRWNFDTVITADLKLVAKWAAAICEVTFDTGVDGPDLASVNVPGGDKIIESEIIIPLFYSILGYYKDSQFTQVWNFSTDTVDNNTTIYVEWELSSTVYNFNLTTLEGSTPNKFDGSKIDWSQGTIILKVYVDKAGTYGINFNYARDSAHSANRSPRVEVTVNDSMQSDRLVCPSTGSDWGTYKDGDVYNVTLQKGANTIVLTPNGTQASGGGYNASGFALHIAAIRLSIVSV